MTILVPPSASWSLCTMRSYNIEGAWLGPQGNLCCFKPPAPQTIGLKLGLLLAYRLQACREILPVTRRWHPSHGHAGPCEHAERSFSCHTSDCHQQRDQTEEFCDQCAHTHTRIFINLRSLVPKGNSLWQNIYKLNFIISGEGAASRHALSRLAAAKRTSLALALCHCLPGKIILPENDLCKKKHFHLDQPAGCMTATPLILEGLLQKYLDKYWDSILSWGYLGSVWGWFSF